MTFIPEDLGTAIVYWLLDATLKATVLLLLVFAAIAWQKRRQRSDAAWNHRLLVASLGTTLLLGLVSALWPHHGATWWTTSIEVGVAQREMPFASQLAPMSKTLVPSAETANTFPAWSVLSSVWAIGAGLVGSILIFQLGILMVWRSICPSANGREWQDALSRASVGFPTRRGVQLKWSDGIDGPMTFGIFRPVILLPRSWSQRDPSSCLSALRHELAHVHRRDSFTNLLAQTTRCVFWFHPLVHLAVRRLERERERACDDRVLQTGVSDVDYATDLVQEIRVQGRTSWRPSIANGLGASGEMKRRIESLLEGRPRKPATARSLSSLSALALAVVLVLGGVQAQPLILPLLESPMLPTASEESGWVVGEFVVRKPGGFPTKILGRADFSGYDIVSLDGICRIGESTWISARHGDSSLLIEERGKELFVESRQGSTKRRLRQTRGDDGVSNVHYTDERGNREFDTRARSWFESVLKLRALQERSCTLLAQVSSEPQGESEDPRDPEIRRRVEAILDDLHRTF